MARIKKEKEKENITYSIVANHAEIPGINIQVVEAKNEDKEKTRISRSISLEGLTDGDGNPVRLSGKSISMLKDHFGTMQDMGGSQEKIEQKLGSLLSKESNGLTFFNELKDSGNITKFVLASATMLEELSNVEAVRDPVEYLYSSLADCLAVFAGTDSVASTMDTFRDYLLSEVDFDKVQAQAENLEEKFGRTPGGQIRLRAPKKAKEETSEETPE